MSMNRKGPGNLKKTWIDKIFILHKHYSDSIIIGLQLFDITYTKICVNFIQHIQNYGYTSRSPELKLNLQNQCIL
jgi:hypothetical protein